MAGSRCARCGRKEFLPFRCRLCAQPHCLEHRLPENHACPSLGEYRARVREERAFGLPREEDLEVRVRGPSRLEGAAARTQAFFTRSMTHRLLGAILFVYALQWVVGIAYGAATGVGALHGVAELTCALALGSCDGRPFSLDLLAAKPWSVLTNVFAHHLNPLHIFFNALFLYFFGFGLALEQRVGPRKLLALFLVAGVVAGLVQAVVFPGAVLGASGALMGILGLLTVLAPTMRILILIVPAPLWVLTLFFIVLDLSGALSAQAGIANVAHLAGLAVGLAEGWRLRKRGVLPRITTAWAWQRRS